MNEKRKNRAKFKKAFGRRRTGKHKKSILLTKTFLTFSALKESLLEVMNAKHKIEGRSDF